MTKTKVVLENANWRRSEAKGQETRQESTGVPKEDPLIIF